MGRNCKLNDELSKKICGYIAKGVPRMYAAQACGITERTFYYWIEKGRQAKSGKYFHFFHDVEKADAQAIVKHVNIINKKADEGQWQPSAWMLERRYPEHYGKRLDAKVEHSGKISFEQLRELLKTDENEPES